MTNSYLHSPPIFPNFSIQVWRLEGVFHVACMPLKGDPSENDRKTAKLFSKIPRRGGVGFIKKKFSESTNCLINLYSTSDRPPTLPTSGPPDLRPSTRPKFFHSAAVRMSEYNFVQSCTLAYIPRRGESLGGSTTNPTKNSSTQNFHPAAVRMDATSAANFCLLYVLWLSDIDRYR
jgi:hypothetical protein